MADADYGSVGKWFLIFIVVAVIALCLFTGVFRVGTGAIAAAGPDDKCLKAGPVGACFHSPSWPTRPVEPDQEEH